MNLVTWITSHKWRAKKRDDARFNFYFDCNLLENDQIIISKNVNKLKCSYFRCVVFPFFARCSLSFELLLCCILDLRHISVMCCGSFFFPSLAIFNSSQFHNFFLVCVVTRAYHSLIHISLVFFFLFVCLFLFISTNWSLVAFWVWRFRCYNHCFFFFFILYIRFDEIIKMLSPYVCGFNTITARTIKFLCHWYWIFWCVPQWRSRHKEKRESTRMITEHTCVHVLLKDRRRRE